MYQRNLGRKTNLCLERNHEVWLVDFFMFTALKNIINQSSEIHVQTKFISDADDL